MQKQKPALLLLCAAFMCSIGGVCIRLSPWPPLAINGGRGIIAAGVTFAYLFASHHRLRLNAAILQSAVSLCLTMYLYVLCAKLTSAANAILLMYTSPIFVMLYMCLVKKQKPRRKEIYTTLLVLGGIVFFVLDGLKLGNIIGDIIGIASGCAYAGVFLVNTGKSADAMSSYFYGQLFAGLIGLPSLISQTNYSLVPVLTIILLGVFQLGLSYILMAKGMQNTQPVTASLITCIEPILSPVWVLLICKEGMSAQSSVGAVMVISGVILSAVLQTKDKY